MESTSGGSGITSLLQTTKTKLLVLSSLLGVSAIIYFTKNYLEKGKFLPTWSSSTDTSKKSILKRQPTIVGGQRHVVIKDDDRSSGSKRVLRRQRSRHSSISSSKRSRSVYGITKPDAEKQSKDNATDVNLNEAINDFSKSVSEIEEVLGINNETNVKSNRSSLVIENELNRLRQMLDFAQDIQLVNEKTSVYIHGQHKAITEDLNIEDAPEVTCEGYDEIVNLIRDQKNFSDDWDDDSDNDSFLSAAESIEIQDSAEDIVTLEMNLKELIGKHCKHDYYMHGIEYLTNYGVPVRAIRTELLQCDNDVDFCVKVYCIRRAFKNLLKKKEYKEWFVECGREVLSGLIRKANYDDTQFFVDFNDMMNYCEDANNWESIEEELSGRGICYVNFYDIILDFIIMDSFQDLENPPAGITTAIHNRWLSLRIKETALSTAIWTVIKGKKRMLENPAGFFSRFYDISMHITPILAWGFLGPVEDLNKLCSSFKKSIQGFLCDIFSTETANYKSVQTLSDDILRLAKKRKEEIITLIS